MKNVFKILFTSVVMTGFLFLVGLIFTLIPTAVLLILKLVLGYEWFIVLLPTYVFMVVMFLVIIGMIFSKNFRDSVKSLKKQ